MSPLEAAQVKELAALLGYERHPNYGCGAGRSVLTTITDLHSRLDALEGILNSNRAKRHRAILEAVEASKASTIDGFETVTQYMVHPTGFNYTPTDASKAVSFNPMDEDATNGNVLRYLLNLSGRTIELAFDFSDDFDTKASPQRMEALKAVRDSLKGMKSTIDTLNTEIATRDRLLDDQAATIGKLEDKLAKAERDAGGSRPTICGYEDLTKALPHVRALYAAFLENVRKAGVQ